MGYPVEMFEGVHKSKKEADIVLFNGLSREKENALLVIECKKKNVNEDNIGQAKSYAQQVLPAYYVITNGQQIMVFKYNGSLAPDECVMNFDKSNISDKWIELAGYISKKAALSRKSWLIEKFKK